MQTLLLVGCLAVVAMAADPDAIVPEAPELATAGKTVRYLLRGSTAEATSQLHSGWKYQVKSEERTDGLVETFGEHAHKSALTDMGFELIEAQMGDGFETMPQAKAYHTPAQLHEAFTALAAKYPQQAKLLDLTAEYKMPKTIQGRSIHALKITLDNVAEDASKPNVLVVTNHHARELITPELALFAATEMLEKHDSDPEMKKILSDFQVYVLWTMNPDGLAITWTKDNWQRTNARNVDLNRNYPIGWDMSCAGTTSGGETFRGTHPFSEVETQTMRAFQNDRNFAKVMDFHSYSQQVRTNYGPCAHLPEAIDERFQQISEPIAQKMGYQAARSCCMGGDIHYAYNRHGSLSYLVEIGTAFQPTDPMTTVHHVWPGLKYFLALKPSVTGVVRDAKGQPVADAQILLPNLDFSMKERFQSGKNGHFHIWLPEGKHEVVVKVAGQPDKHVTVDATDAGTVQDITV